jgi:short-subunit dehydrogenase
MAPSRSPEEFQARYGPWAVVAGATEGIGREFARQLAARGMHVVLVARREALLTETAGEIQAGFGVQVRTTALDLAAADLVERLRPALAGVEIGLLVYNAALSVLQDFDATSPDDLLRQLYVNCRGPLLLCRELAAPMAARGRGGIVLMSSASGFVGSGLTATYAATKAFDSVLGEGLWQDLRPRGVDVLACVAGATRTPNFERQMRGPQRAGIPVMEPADVAREALAALGGPPLHVVGRGNRLAAFLLTPLLPRPRASRLMTRSTRALHGS